MLQDAGIDFSALKQKGIEPLVLADYLTSSGLILNDEIRWITFHGAFDYAYLIKILTNSKLEGTYDQYETTVNTYFPCTLDTKIIAQDVDDIKGNSLQKLGNEFGVDCGS